MTYPSGRVSWRPTLFPRKIVISATDAMHAELTALAASERCSLAEVARRFIAAGLDATPAPLLATVAAPDATATVASPFETFWALVPKKIGRLRCAERWAKMTAADRADATAGMRAQVDAGMLDGGEFDPHAATWLNGNRWEDEITRAVDPTAPGHIVTEQAAPAKRCELCSDNGWIQGKGGARPCPACSEGPRATA